jgi:hypothetical protein
MILDFLDKREQYIYIIFCPESSKQGTDQFRRIDPLVALGLKGDIGLNNEWGSILILFF